MRANSMLLALALVSAACEQRLVNVATAAPTYAPALSIPSAEYRADPQHTNVTARVLHQGFSNYTFRFDRAHVSLNLDAADQSRSTLDAVVDVSSVNTGLPSFDSEVAEFLGAPQHAEARFLATSVVWFTENTGQMDGVLSLNGRSMPLVLSMTLNRAGADMFGGPRLGVSAAGVVRRSQHGVASQLPAADVAEEVAIQIEIELVPASRGD